MSTLADLPLLIQPRDLLPQLENPQLLLIDICSEDNYQQGHIPGAIHVKPSELVCGIKPATGKLPDIEALTQLCQRIGLTPDHHVVVYDDEGSGWAGRFIWTLDVLGHQHYSCLDGGLLSWRAEDYPLSIDTPQPQASDYQVTIQRDPIIELEELLPLLGSEELAIWDARSPAEYEGSKVVSARGGHIPGARNYNWTDLMDQQHQLRLLPLEQIQAKLDALGIHKDKLVVTHCQTHHRSGLTYLAAKLLGYPKLKAYHGSWSEWGNREDTPIATGNENP